MKVKSTCLIIALLASSAVAIQPGKWTHTTEAHFTGKKDNTVATNLGDIKLSVGSTVLSKMPEKSDIVYDIQALADGSTYLAAGPEAKLLKYPGAAKDDKKENNVDVIAELKDEQIFALDVAPDGKLLVGISGDPSRIATLDGKELKTVIELKDARYVWDLLINGNDAYIATGTDGKLLHVDLGAEEKKATELLDAKQPNLLCIGRDAKGRVYAGTDKDGLVYRVTKVGDKFETFVIYDANEAEIGAILVTGDGTVYAGTAAANQARPGRMNRPATTQKGRPAKPDAKAPDKAVKPEPKAPAKPDAKKTNGDAKPDAPKPAPEAPKPAPEKKIIVPGAKPLALADDKPKVDAPAGEATKPTQEQRDRLRDEIRDRLQKARQTGQIKPSEMQASPSAPRTTTSSSTRTSTTTSSRPKGGNAVYKIDSQGFVNEVFRESVMILRLVLDGDNLLVATGNEGQLYKVNLTEEETIIVADLEPKQVPAILRAKDGSITLGTANPATLVKLESGFAKKGEYTSKPLDASQVSLWGTLKVSGTIPANTSISISTRSGNVADPEKAPWSEWSKAQTIEHDAGRPAMTPVQLKVTSPPARLLQYKVTLNGDGNTSSVLDSVSIAYVMPNLKPTIATMAAAYTPARTTTSTSRTSSSSSTRPPVTPPSQYAMNILWTAVDPNKDKMVYQLDYRAAGTDNWIMLAEKLPLNRYIWDTRRVPDGRYIVRVTASDSPGNTPDMAESTSRNSDPVVVDNSVPSIENLKNVVKPGSVTITATINDKLSDIRDVKYAVDSTKDWQPALPDDLIYDSTSEQLTIRLSDLSPGSHVVTIRATDTQGNAVYHALPVVAQ